jgi:DNA-directed RNA polymerase specialized sigma24 family protein
MPHAKKAKVRFRDRRAYSLAEIAGLTGLAISTLYKLMASGRLKTQKIAGRRIVTDEALADLLGESGTNLGS